MYFDRIERSEVTELLDGIYKNVHLLEDVQFLVQYAPQVLPPTVPEASGERIWANILALHIGILTPKIRQKIMKCPYIAYWKKSSKLDLLDLSAYSREPCHQVLS